MGATLNLDAVTIVPELQGLLPQPTAAERQLITEAVADEKQKIQPLTVWHTTENEKQKFILVDGHTRYAAMKAAGMTQASVEFRTFADMNEAKLWMIKLQLGRRNLDASQRAMIAAELVTTKHGGDRKSDQGTNSSLDISQAEAAELLNVSETSVKQAEAIKKTAEPELVKAVKDGVLSLNAAKQLDKAAPEVQREIAAAPKPKKAAKEFLSKPAATNAKTFDKSVQDGQYNGKKLLKTEAVVTKFLGELEQLPAVLDSAVCLISTLEEENRFVPLVNKIRQTSETLIETCKKARTAIAVKAGERDPMTD